MSDHRLVAYIICWTGWEERSRDLAAALVEHVGRLVVVYSNRAGTIEDGAGHWMQVPDDYFYGRKFESSLLDFDGDIMLHVQADAVTEDWGALVARCRERFATRPDLAIWSPEVDYTPLPVWLTSLADLGDDLRLVTSTDSVVWALSAEICDWLRPLDLALDHYGWGIDIGVAIHAHALAREVVIDHSVFVDHPKSRAYDSENAYRLELEFLEAALTPAEQRLKVVLDSGMATRRELVALEENTRTIRRAARALRAGPRAVSSTLRRLRGGATPAEPN
ncbi:hypothetical protein [Agromyces seonyuensis]|uniref:Uncharacterized protein n=1 Tax=Agromyces seonyuensis TaxID=2662446 RepID=A0A6I4P278_9MICO|nr:hypothetical protein [Agromyces seonyuensis]MWB97274.1 hypothetical protein [Agromyces seonyuensis]